MLNSVWIVGINTIVDINIGACIGLGVKRRNIGVKINVRIIRIGVDVIGMRIRFGIQIRNNIVVIVEIRYRIRILVGIGKEKVTALIDVDITKPRNHSCRDR